MMVERLRAYQKQSKSLPERVLVFRDGVSEVSLDPPFIMSLLRATSFIGISSSQRANTTTLSSEQNFLRYLTLSNVSTRRIPSTVRNFPSSSAANGTTRASPRRPRLTSTEPATPIPAPSSTKASHQFSTSISTSRRTPACKVPFGPRTTSLSTTKTLWERTRCSRVFIPRVICTRERPRR